MRVFVTGGTGFIGGRLVSRLRERGDDVVALVRNPATATGLAGAGCTVVTGTLADVDALAEAMQGCDSVFHIAGRFEVGLPSGQCPDMHAVNVEGTRNVLDACERAGVKRVVYASTVNAFGNTEGSVVDESYRRDPAGGYRSCYDETKYRAHLISEDRAAAGMPLVTVMPGVVYGPGDHFEIGRQILMAARGRLPVLMLVGIGVDMTYVDDAADGFLLAHDRGTIGEQYVIGGENLYLRDVIRRSAELAGVKPPRVEIPTGAIRAIAPLGPVMGRLFGYPPNLRELIEVADGTTYWATHTKAGRELGYQPRSLDDGLRATLQAAGIATPN